MSTPIRELGKDFSFHDWQDYRSILSAEELDEAYLLGLLSDDSFAEALPDSPLPWVPLHAWRALAQLGAPSVMGADLLEPAKADRFREVGGGRRFRIDWLRVACPA